MSPSRAECRKGVHPGVPEHVCGVQGREGQEGLLEKAASIWPQNMSRTWQQEGVWKRGTWEAIGHQISGLVTGHMQETFTQGVNV